MAISLGGIVITKLLADRANLSSEQASRVLLFGGLLGNSPIGIFVTNEMIQREAANRPSTTTATTPTTTTPTTPTTPVPTTGTGKVQIPDLLNQTFADAQQRLNFLGLKVQAVNADSANIIGLVIAQNPAAGSIVSAGATITLTVSQGLNLPDLTGRTITDAQAILTGLGLAPRPDRRRNPAAKDTVIETVPAKNTRVSAGTEVIIAVSDGPTITVPSVVNTKFVDAEKAIKDAGLIVSKTDVVSPSINKDFVVSQVPPAGSSAMPGTNVILSVSRGQGVVVPDISGKTQGEAESILKDHGLVPTVQTQENDVVVAGFVISQTPPAGELVSSGAAVTVTISMGPTRTTQDLPNFVGQRHEVGRETLQDMDIRVAPAVFQNDAGDAGIIIAQEPPPGPIDAETAVIFTVSLGPAQVPAAPEPAKSGKANK